MRAKEVTTRLFLVLAMIGFFTVNAFSADAWYTCTIKRVGGYTAANGVIQVSLTDTKGSFSGVYFKIQEGRLNQMLAVFLTAASNGSTVYVKADPVAKTLSAAYYIVE
jgi:hypothetical protein